MDGEVGLLSRLFDFGWALLPHWWLLATGFIFAVEPMIEALAPPSWRGAVNRHWSKETRQLHFRWASLVAVLVASFLAFDDVSTRNRALQTSVTTVTGERDEARRQRDRNTSPITDRLSGDLTSARAKIDALEKSNAALAAAIPPKYPLTDAEKTRLLDVLNAASQNERFAVELYWPQLNGTRGYADRLATVFKDANWNVSVRMAAMTNGHGLTFAIPKNARKPIHPEALKLMELLSRAKVPFAIGELDIVPDGTFAFVIGQPAVAPELK